MQSNILYGVLNWGLGHASRSIPIIEKLIEKGYALHIASSGDALTFLKERFPYQSFLELPDYEVRYHSASKFPKTAFTLKSAKSYKAFLRMIEESKTQVNIYAESNNIDYIISDNHYGCVSKRAPSAIICHQLKLKAPFIAGAVNKRHVSMLSHFNEIWVPDFSVGEGLSGELSLNPAIEIPSKAIGLLSHINAKGNGENLLVVLSGPEPQRQLLADRLLTEIETTLTTLRGLFTHIDFVHGSNVSSLNDSDFITHYKIASTDTLTSLFLKSKLVICRSGYSSLMDLVLNEKPALLIPTPGQSEQEYLAKHCSDMGWFCVQEQNKIDLSTGLDKCIHSNIPSVYNSTEQMETILDNFLSK